MMQPTAEPFEWPILAYMIMAGTSAGVAVTGYVLSRSKNTALLQSARQSLFIATVCIAIGFPLLILDLEKPEMFWYILYHFNPRSVIAWGARGISVYFGLLVALSLFYTRVQQHLRLYRLALAVVGVLALFVGLYPGLVLNQAVARPLWDQPILPVLFLSSGIHMGFAVVMLARFWTAGAPGFVPEASEPLLHDHPVVRKTDAVLIGLQVVFLGVYLLSCWAVAPAATTALITGGYGLLLWGGVVVVGWIVPGLDMLIRGDKSSLTIRCVCVVIGGVCLRVLVINGGQGAVAFLGS